MITMILFATTILPAIVVSGVVGGPAPQPKINLFDGMLDIYGI